jgi:hypothetical protein
MLPVCRCAGVPVPPGDVAEDAAPVFRPAPAATVPEAGCRVVAPKVSTASGRDVDPRVEGPATASPVSTVDDAGLVATDRRWRIRAWTSTPDRVAAALSSRAKSAAPAGRCAGSRARACRTTAAIGRGTSSGSGGLSCSVTRCR